MSANPSEPCRYDPDSSTLSLEVHLVPGAQRTGVAGRHGGSIRIRLAAPAVEGRANAELVRFLAEAFGVRTASVTLVRGQASRRKCVRIERPRLRPDLVWSAEPG